MSNEKMDLMKVLEGHRAEFKKIAPKYISIERLIGLAVQAKMKNHLLAKCTSVSVIDFCMKMAEAGTDRVGSGGMWCVPFKDKSGNYNMVAIPDWRLIIDKARRAGVIKHATAEAVYEGDEFSYERGLEPKLVHKPSMKSNKKKLIAVYCIYTLPDGSKDFDVMTKDEVDAIRRRSKAKDSGPWVTDFAEMAKKTVIKRGLKIFEGASPELTKLMDMDNEVTGFAELTSGEETPIVEPKPIDVDHEEVPIDKKEEDFVCDNPTKNPFCKGTIAKVVYDFSMEKYKKPLCRSCQEIEKGKK